MVLSKEEKRERYIILLKHMDVDFIDNKNQYDLECIEEKFDRIFELLSEDEVAVLIHKFGLIDGKSKTLFTIAGIINKSKSTVHKIIMRLKRKLRRKHMLEILKIEHAIPDINSDDENVIPAMNTYISNIGIELVIYEALDSIGIKYLKDLERLDYEDLINLHKIGNKRILKLLKYLEKVDYPCKEWRSKIRSNIKEEG